VSEVSVEETKRKGERKIGTKEGIILNWFEGHSCFWKT